MSRLAAGALVASQAPHHQLARFAAVGAANTLFAFALYSAGLLAGLPYWLASLAGLCAGIATGFVAQGRLVFRSGLSGRFTGFAILWALLYLANILLIRLIAGIGLDYYLAGLLALAPVTALSFLIQRSLVFAPAEAKEGAGSQTWIALLALALAVCAGMRLHLLFVHEVNWDEFLNLSMVYGHARGDTREILQTLFVHLFGWLPLVSANEVDQVIAARLLVFAPFLLTSLALFGIARRFVPIEAALFAVLAFNAFSFVLRHGGALRTDPLALACMMAALWLAVSGRLRWPQALVLGAAVGLAGAFTIKAIFLVPTLAAILLVRFAFDGERKRLAGSILAAGAAAILAFAAILALHWSSLEDPASPFAFLARTSGATLARSDFSALAQYLPQALAANPAFWVLLVLGAGAAAGRLRDRAGRREGLMLLAFGLPLLSLLFYSEAYPYFFPLLLAPASILAGFGFGQLLGLRRGFHAAVALVVTAASMGVTYVRSVEQGVGEQRRTLALVHRLFPEPVPYVDANSMVSSFPKTGLFMSRWGMADYRRNGRPVMERVLAGDQPRFLLDSRGSLDLSRDPAISERHPLGLLGVDLAALQASFIPYWGPLYVPGFGIEAGRRTVPVRLGGMYRLDAAAPVTVDGRAVAPGQRIALAPGPHVLASPAPAMLRLDLPPPPRDDPPDRLFAGF